MTDIIGQPFYKMLSQNYIDLITENSFEYNQPYEIEIVRQNHSKFHSEMRIKKSESDHDIELVSIRDITNQKQSQHIDIERIVRHDLKSPINGVISLIQLLFDYELSSDQHEIISMILLNTNKMIHMIDNSIDLYKMEKGIYQLQLEEFDLLSLLHDLDSEFEMLKVEKSSQINIFLNDKAVSDDENYWLVGEQVHIKTLFANLIKNSLEATPKNKNVTISIKFDEKKEVHLIDIHNFGSVPKDIQESFFQKYVTLKEGGTGLGTVSALMIAKIHGGHIRFQSSDEEGTYLIVSLPHKVVN